MVAAVSGIQHCLRAGEYEACIASVGASLRSLTYAGRDLVVPFDADEVRPHYRGATLVPWPNRVVDGAYTFDGVDYRLALTEPERLHALHGLGAWLDYEPVDKGPSHVTLSARIEPQSGYPWRLHIETTYALEGDGLTQTVRVTNLSQTSAPYGTGPHPYLVAGGAALDAWTLELPAGEVLEVTSDRLAPVRLRAVDADDAERFDYRTPRAIGAAQIDHAYTALAATDGVTTVRLHDPSGTGVEMVWDAACPWVQVHTADRPGGAADPAHRAGLAVEPMTCAPDAFNAAGYDYDAGLIALEPGGVHDASWRIAAVTTAPAE